MDHRDRKAAERAFENTTLIPSEAPKNVDMKSLVVGQEVYVFPGHEAYGYWKGKMVKIVPPGVDVQLDEPVDGESLIRFDYDGEEMLADQQKWDMAPEQHPWTLDDMPFAERTAEIERWQRELDARRGVG